VPFRVLTLNMHYGDGDPGPLEELIARHLPDVVAVQEWPGAGRSALRSAPGWHVHATSRLFLASRHPILRAVELGGDSMGDDASAAHYELDTPAGPVHVFSLHLATTRRGITDTLHEDWRGPAEVQANSARRREQAAFIADRAAACRGPVLVLGDFNTPPESPIFPEVWGGYTDAFSAAGWGWGYTFVGARTAVRIDHILAGKEWECTGCRVGPAVGSPHRPVIAELAWSGETDRDVEELKRPIPRGGEYPRVSGLGRVEEQGHQPWFDRAVLVAIAPARPRGPNPLHRREEEYSLLTGW
jgi:endonuclease/exonuclease/phosphatase family metal-dependent hydrolase